MRSIFEFWRYTRLVMVGAACMAVGLALNGCALLQEGERYIDGMESYVYGYPIVMMDVTWEVMTAAAALAC